MRRIEFSRHAVDLSENMYKKILKKMKILFPQALVKHQNFKRMNLPLKNTSVKT